MRPAVVGVAYFAWLYWRRLLKPLLAAAVGLGFVALLPVWDVVRWLCSQSAFVVVLCCYYMFVLRLATDDDRLGFPRALLRLPVRTGMLVFLPWLFAVAGPAFLLATVGVLFGPARRSVLMPALALTAGTGWALVAYWAPFRSLFLKLSAVVAGMVWPGALGLWLSQRVGLPRDATAAILVVCLAVSFPAALACVARDRRGDAWRLGLSLAGRRRAGTVRPAPTRQPFPSPDRAQGWFFWSSPPGWKVRLALSPIIAGLASFVWSLTQETAFLAQSVIVLVLVVVPLLCVLLTGLGFAKVAVKEGEVLKWIGAREQMTFLFLRPIGTGRLAADQLRDLLLVLTWGWTFGLAIGLVACLCWSAFPAGPGRVLHDVQLFFGRLWAWQALGVVVLAWVAAVGLTWRYFTDLLVLALFGQPGGRTYYGVSLALIGSNGLTAAGLCFLLDPATRAPAAATLMVTGVVVLGIKLVFAAIVLRVARNEDLLEGVSPRLFFLWWAVIAAALVGWTALLLPGFGLPVPTGLVLLWALILLPLGRFALLPLGLSGLRHL